MMMGCSQKTGRAVLCSLPHDLPIARIDDIGANAQASAIRHFRHMARTEKRPDSPRSIAARRRWVPSLHTLSALRHRDYRYLWIANSFSSTASWIQQVALALLVADLTDDSPFWVGTVLGIRALPILLVGPLAGVAVDRLDRKKLLMVTQLFLVVTALLFAWGVSRDEVNEFHALLFSFLLGLDMTINQPVRQSLIANVVPKEGLTNALALENSVGNIIRVIAPALGIALITPFGFAGNFLIQGVAYLAVFLVVIPMRTPYREGRVESTSVLSNFMEGLKYIKSDVTLLLLIVLIIIPSVLVHSTQFLLVIFAKDLVSGDEKLALVLLYVSMGIGALVGTFSIASLGNFQVKGMVNMGSILLVSVLLIFFGLSSYLVLSLVLIGLMGVFNQIFRIANNSLVQSRIPDVLRGRITSIYVIDHGVQPIGIPLLGLLAVAMGVGNALAVAGVAGLAVTAFIGLRWRGLWQLR